MDGGLLSLKWNNHRTTFFHVLTCVREKNTYSDVTLACEGKFYKSHKLVLSTCSDYFSQMFEETQCKHPVIVLKDIKSEEIESLLNYMYIGEVNVVQEKLAGLIKAAECLRIKGLAVPDEEPKPSKPSVREKRASDTNAGSDTKRQRQDDVNGDINSRKQTTNFNNSRSEERSKFSDSNNMTKKTNQRSTCNSTKGDGDCNKPQSANIKTEVKDNFPAPFVEVRRDAELSDPVKLEPVDDAVYLSDDSISATDSKNLPNQDDFEDNPHTFLDDILEHNSTSDMGEYVHTGDGSGTSGQQQQPVSGDALCNMGESWTESASSDFASPSDFAFIDSADGVPDPALPSGWAHPQINPNVTLPSFDEIVFRCRLYRSQGKRYLCPVCKFSFGDKTDFKRHYMIHTGEKPLKCPHCEYGARQSNSLKSHIKKYHSDDQENE